MDQATSLRELYIENEVSLPISYANEGIVILVTSGKGGVGKSLLTVNLAASIGTAENPVLIIDANSRGTHLNMMIGSNPKYRMDDIVSGDVSILDAKDTTLDGVHLIAGFEELPVNEIKVKESEKIVGDNLHRLSHDYSLTLIDCGASRLENLEWYSAYSTSILMVTTPEITSITDAYALTKYLYTKAVKDLDIHLLVNQSRSEKDSRNIAGRFNLMTNNFLNLEVSYAGHIPMSDMVSESVANQSPAVLQSGADGLNRLFKKIMNRLYTGEMEKINNVREVTEYAEPTKILENL